MINKDILIQGPIKQDLVNQIIAENNQGNIGAQSIFLGQVRNDILEGKKVLEIDYSAYEEMTKAEMDKIFAYIISKYDDIQKVYVKHSVGKVKAGEHSLFVFVASGHRRQAFKAVEEIVDLIKEKLPVWKKEILDDGGHVWTEN
ncbi:MAG: molybdenum cofactor biosynthesis protein MoaE [Bacteroidota bacterium]